jgi:hypothetical protein
MTEDEHLEVSDWIDHSDSSEEEDLYEDGPSGLSTWPEKLQAMQIE